MKIRFVSIPQKQRWNQSDVLNLPKDIARMLTSSHALGHFFWNADHADSISTVLEDWAEDTMDRPFEMEETDDNFPVNNGISISGKTLHVWVLNSEITVINVGDGSFVIEANGARSSFALNPTGEIGEYFYYFRNRAPVEVETQAGAPWDKQTSPFVQTLVCRLGHLSEWKELKEIGKHDAELASAMEKILCQIKSPDLWAEVVDKRFHWHETWEHWMLTRNSPGETPEEYQARCPDTESL